jgi:hypothetical protein
VAVEAALAAGGMGVAALGVVGRMLWKGRTQQREEAHTYEKPPGAYREAWSTPRIVATRFPTSVRSWPRMLVGTALGWGVTITAVVSFILPMTREGGTGMGLVAVALTCLIWGTSLYFTYKIYEGVRHRRHYDRGVFEMEEVPARLGGRVSGTVHTGMDPGQQPAEGFTVSLECTRRSPGGQGDSTTYRTRWSAESEPNAQLGTGDGLALDVDFALPADQPPSTLEFTDDRVFWHLDVEAPDADPPYEQSFEVPVFPAKR